MKTALLDFFWLSVYFRLIKPWRMHSRRMENSQMLTLTLK